MNTAVARHSDRLPILASHWGIDPSLTFLNHGSYGAVPTSVLRFQTDLRARVERDAVRFYKVDLESLMDGMRTAVGRFVNCPADTLAPIANATIAIATVLAHHEFAAGDEILVTDHEYMSGLNEFHRIIVRTGARIVTAHVPFPAGSPDEVLESIRRAITPRTRFMMVSWITSATSLIFPIKEIIALARSRGITLLVDGTHAPGQIPVDIADLDPDYFVGSFHKWVSAPKGTGFLYVPKARQDAFRTLCLSSRGHKVRPDRPLYLRDFDYMGTDDYTAILSVPAAIEAMGSLLPPLSARDTDGWTNLFARNHAMALHGVQILHEILGLPPTAPGSMTGSMATLVLPSAPESLQGRKTRYDDPLQDALYENHSIVVPIWQFTPASAPTNPPTPPTTQRVVRISAQLYNSPDDYRHLADALKVELAAEA